MSIWMQRPQKISDIYLNIGDEYGRPQDIHEGEGGPSPGHEHKYPRACAENAYGCIRGPYGLPALPHSG